MSDFFKKATKLGCPFCIKTFHESKERNNHILECPDKKSSRVAKFRSIVAEEQRRRNEAADLVKGEGSGGVEEEGVMNEGGEVVKTDSPPEKVLKKQVKIGKKALRKMKSKARAEARRAGGGGQ